MRGSPVSTLLKVGLNTTGRDFVVGDVHGHFSQLQHQLKLLQFDGNSDRLFCVGDVVDRGEESEAMLELVDQRRCFSVLGNHEAMMIAGFEKPEDAGLHLSNGGEWFYRLPRTRQQRYAEQARTWPWAIEIETSRGPVGLVHANVPQSSWHEVSKQLQAMAADWQAGAPLTSHAIEYAAQNLLWNRTLVLRLYSEFLESEANKRRIVAHWQSPGSDEWVAQGTVSQLAPFDIEGVAGVCMGHTYVPVPIRAGRCHFLDTYRGDPGEALGIICINAS
nr:metallophosphoesterase [Microbulbifer guangxiensis]